MENQTIKVEIEGSPFLPEELEKWKAKRVKKACRTLRLKLDSKGSAEEIAQQLTTRKIQMSTEDMLALLKGKLGLSRLGMKLISGLSGKRRRMAKTRITAQGISAERFSKRLEALMIEPDQNYRRVNLSVYPEHYVLRPNHGTLEVVETTGNAPLPTQFFITFGDEAGLMESRDPRYPFQSAGIARLNDQTEIGGVRHQFRDTTEGLECLLCVEFPGLCPKFLVKAHQKHLAVEFTNWLTWILAHQSEE